MKVLITTSSFGKIDQGPLKELQHNGLQIISNPLGRKLTELEVLELILEHKPIGIIAGVEPLTAKVLYKASNLKAIARAGIGMDSVDLEVAKKLSISVTNTPEAPTMAVAELTIGVILSLLRMLHISDASIRFSKWSRPMGHLLYKKTVGIIGCGRIGKKIADYLKIFECTVIASDQVNFNSEGISFMELDELLLSADIVTLHLPYSKQNHHIINNERISIMKKGAYLVNAARGGLVDENALLEALKSGHLAGAALDCFEKEPYDGPLKDLPNVLLTAHLGSYAKEARLMMETQAARNLIKQLQELCILSKSVLK